MGKYNFKEDLKSSKTCERRVAKFLETRGATEIEFNDDNRYDILYKKDGKYLTLEIKEDMLYTTTGNVAIEVSSRGKPSGICTSVADNWCYVLGKDLYFCKRSSLLQNLLTTSYKSALGGDDYTSILMLIPIKKFDMLCDVIKGGLV